MALLEETGWNVLKGVVIGIGATVLARHVYPPFKHTLRPLVKATIRSSLDLAESGRMVLARLGESLEDLVAEVMAERAQERKGAGGGPATPGKGGEDAT